MTGDWLVCGWFVVGWLVGCGLWVVGCCVGGLWVVGWCCWLVVGGVIWFDLTWCGVVSFGLVLG